MSAVNDAILLLLFFITSKDSIKVKRKKRHTINHTLVS